MKESDLEKLKPCDVVVFVKVSPSTNALHEYKVGDRLIFERYDYTIDTFYFLRSDPQGYILCTFSSNIHRFIELESTYLARKRNIKIDKILPILGKKLNG